MFLLLLLLLLSYFVCLYFSCCLFVCLFFFFLSCLLVCLLVKWFVPLAACLILIACFPQCTFSRHQNVCSSSPCFHNATCLNGFTDKRYRCLCPIGYTGGNCEIGKIKLILAIYYLVVVLWNTPICYSNLADFVLVGEKDRLS